jgi:hypothetical protein
LLRPNECCRQYLNAHHEAGAIAIAVYISPAPTSSSITFVNEGLPKHRSLGPLYRDTYSSISQPSLCHLDQRAWNCKHVAMANKLLTRFIEGNAKFAQSYTAPPPLMKMRDMWLKNGNKGAVICTHTFGIYPNIRSCAHKSSVSCSDPRVIPEKFLGLEAGPTAVIRNAGGRASDAMRSLLVLHTINPLGLILVVHHTGLAVQFSGVSDNRSLMSVL